MHQPSDEYFDHLNERLEVIRKRFEDKRACSIFMSMIAGLINRGLCPDKALSEIEKTRDSIEKLASEIDEINERCQPNLSKHQQTETNNA